MKKYLITDDSYYTKTRDRIGGTIRTEVYKRNGVYKAFSSYSQDEEEEIVGYGESPDDKEAGYLSRKELRKEWQEEKM